MGLKTDINFSLLLNPSTEASFSSKESFDMYGKIYFIPYFLLLSAILFFSICMLYI